ncbi:restriction endonuclease subunit S [uncultured Thioclava sp.]|uniref:restriction endonuclease subunit S n=1 Tax=uncultured Thioclava sp. TaxID=473858 RepID=UPI0025DC301D|nr:restriction endonuclease subunit S [uncultured Thioclava sp.]
MVALGNVVEIKGGGTPSKSKPEFYNGDIPWVTPKDMKVWEIFDAIDKITPEAVTNSSTNLIPENTILLVNRSGILKHTLPVGITRRPVAINQDMKALICSAQVHPEYLAHLVKAAEPNILKWVRATTADNFPIQNLKELKIPLPPLEEQKRIAQVLDQADALRRLRTRALDTLNTLGQAIFHEMFGSIKGSKEKASISSQNDGPEWLRCKLGDQIKLQRGYDIVKKDVREGEVPVISSGGISYYHDTVGALGPGVILGRKGSVGKVHFSKQDFWPHDTTLFVKEFNKNIPLFIYYFFKQFSLSDYEASAANPSLNRNNLHPLYVDWPAVDNQLEFSRRIEKVENEMQILRAGISASKALFAALQHRAFRGEL